MRRDGRDSRPAGMDWSEHGVPPRASSGSARSSSLIRASRRRLQQPGRAIITGLLWSENGVRARQIRLTPVSGAFEELDGYRFQAVGCLNLGFDPSAWPEREKESMRRPHGTLYTEILDTAQLRCTSVGRASTCPTMPSACTTRLGGYSEPR